MILFCHEFFASLFILMLFSVSGYWLLVPFRSHTHYWLWGTPLAGLLIITLGTSTLYALLGFSLAQALWVTLIACFIFSSITLRFCRPILTKDDAFICLFALLALGLIVYLTNYTSIKMQHHGLLFIDGSDQLGYAQLAEWLKLHLVSQQPVADSNLPQQSWPAYMFQTYGKIDAQRFGSYFILAIISLLHQTSSMFTFDMACGIVIFAGYLAVSAVFTRTTTTFILLFLGLLTGLWLDYSRSGYFSKILVYPATLFILGLYFSIARRTIPLFTTAVMAALTGATAIMAPATSLATLLAVVGLVFISSRFLANSVATHKEAYLVIVNDAVLIVLLIGIAIATTGMLALPVSAQYYTLAVSWHTLLPYVLEILPAIALDNFLAHWPIYLSILALLVSASLLIIALIKKQLEALVLLLVPLITLLGFVIVYCLAAHQLGHIRANAVKWLIYELTGIFYPLLLCGVALLIDNSKPQSKVSTRSYRWLVIVLMLALIAVHLPRLKMMIPHYAGSAINPRYQFSKTELDGLVQAMDDHKVMVGNLSDTNLTLPILIYVMPLHAEIIWSPAAWHAILGYRSWSVPPQAKNVRLFIVLATEPVPNNCQIRFKTRQYYLLQC